MSKDFLEAGKRRLAGDTARAATSDEVKALRQEASTLKEVVAEQALELRLLKKSMTEDGETPHEIFGIRKRRCDIEVVWLMAMIVECSRFMLNPKFSL